SNCSQAISLRYPFIEISSCLLAIYLTWHFGWSWQMAATLLFSWILICLIFIDFDHQLLPDDLTLSLLWLGLIANTWHTFCSSQDAIMGAVAGYLSLWLIANLFKWISGREGMGYGDFKLLAALGAWAGWQMLPLIILLSSIAGALVGLGLMVFKNHNRDIPIPFGPYLAIAGWIALLFGKQLVNVYAQTIY
ncbi:MAG: pilD, partial [Gammaproteobacteria bacterium]|nr:pilD [Gammaproteobacteria bacterium]